MKYNATNQIHRFTVSHFWAVILSFLVAFKWSKGWFNIILTLTPSDFLSFLSNSNVFSRLSQSNSLIQPETVSLSQIISTKITLNFKINVSSIYLFFWTIFGIVSTRAEDSDPKLMLMVQQLWQKCILWLFFNFLFSFDSYCPFHFHGFLKRMQV